jgi:hypothetical protein
MKSPIEASCVILQITKIQPGKTHFKDFNVLLMEKERAMVAKEDRIIGSGFGSILRMNIGLEDEIT